MRPSPPIVGLVHAAGTTGYRPLGSNGGISAFGTAPYYGSPASPGVQVTDVGGAVSKSSGGIGVASEQAGG